MPVYTLFGQGSTAGSSNSAVSSETEGMQFSLSAPANLTGIWVYSPAGATALPSGIGIFKVTGAGTGTIVPGSQNNAPTWSGAAGSGWVRCAYKGGPLLTPGNNYKVCMFWNAGGGTIAFIHFYWTTGAGGGGLVSGIISAPNNAGADVGQDSYEAGAAISYPATTFDASNYWIDVEVTTESGLLAGSFP